MAEHWRYHDGIVHCEGIGAGDYLLCGLAPEGERGDEGDATTTVMKINCQHCIAIIEFCKRIRLGEYARTQRARR